MSGEPMLREVVDFISDELSNNFAEQLAATYVTGAGSVSLEVTLGQTMLEVSDENGVAITATSIDVLCKSEDLVIDGDTVEPEAGNQITLPDGRVLEVLEFGSGEAFRYADPFGKRLRIHCKVVEDAEESES